MNKKILTVTLNPAIDFTIEVPNFSIDSVNRAVRSRRDPGGKGINVATALSAGGIETFVTGFLGNDNKDIFLNHFKENSILDNFLYVEGSTREGIKVADTENEITTDINFNGIELNQKDINQFICNFQELIKGYDYVVLSGSLPKNVPTSIYGMLAGIAQKEDIFVAIDTSRESLLSSINSGKINLIKPNIDELSEIYPEIEHADDKEAAVDKLAIRLLNKVEMIALSLGEKGSKLYTRDGIYKANAPKISIKSTVGAGDTFLAGFISGLMHEKPIEDVLKTAVSWAASKLTMYGPGLSKEQPPQQFFEDISVERM
ncbi:MAG: 1-phosphofructokinase family hexose kinase [Spirochaetaceae bacterium]